MGVPANPASCGVFPQHFEAALGHACNEEGSDFG